MIWVCILPSGNLYHLFVLYKHKKEKETSENIDVNCKLDAGFRILGFFLGIETKTEFVQLHIVSYLLREGVLNYLIPPTMRIPQIAMQKRNM